jgi:hypothetical protein
LVREEIILVPTEQMVSNPSAQFYGWRIMGSELTTFFLFSFILIFSHPFHPQRAIYLRIKWVTDSDNSSMLFKLPTNIMNFPPTSMKWPTVVVKLLTCVNKLSNYVYKLFIVAPKFPSTTANLHPPLRSSLLVL